MIRASVPVLLRSTRRQAVRRAALAGVIVVLCAACGGGSSRAAPRPRRTKTSVSSTTTTTTGAPVSYTVKNGDSIASIASMFGVSPAAIEFANHLSNANQIEPGQVLEIPPRPGFQVAVSPTDAQAGGAFTLTVMGAQPLGMVTFQISGPGGMKFTGSPHTADGLGSVTATYQSSPGDTPGTYTVVAVQATGATTRATFRLDPATVQT